MGRAAGDSKYYMFAPLAGTAPLYGEAFKLPSVTSIIKDLTGEGWGPGSYRGFKLGIRSQHPRMSDERIEELYTKAKRGPWDPNRQLKLAADRGTKAHETAEMLAKGYVRFRGQDLVSTNENLDGYSRAACLYFEELGDIESKVLESEKLVYSLKLGYAGTADLILCDRRYGEDQFVTVVDFKTHKPNRENDGAYYTDEIQVSMYMYAWEEMQDLKCPDYSDRQYPFSGEVITLCEDGTYLRRKIRRDWNVAKYVMRVWKEKHYE